jgi:hypothetical protein
MRLRVVGGAFALAVATAAVAQGGAGAQQGSAGTGQAPHTSKAVGPTSDAFDRACVDLLHGRMPEGDRAIKSLREACANLMSGKVDERLEAEKRRQQQLAAQEELRKQHEELKKQAAGAPAGQATVQPGQATAQPSAGAGVAAAFGTAATELTGGPRTKGLGMRGGGRPVGYLLVTNPVGWFDGLGVNAELWGALGGAPMFSWVGGVRYSGTDTSNGSATTFGVEAGFDWFMYGQHNEGLRLGPRVEFAAGRQHQTGGSSTTFGRMGLGGELGYNFIATNGISGLAAVGLGGRVAGDSKNENFASFVGGEFGPYAKIGLGYAW